MSLMPMMSHATSPKGHPKVIKGPSWGRFAVAATPITILAPPLPTSSIATYTSSGDPNAVPKPKPILLPCYCSRRKLESTPVVLFPTQGTRYSRQSLVSHVVTASYISIYDKLFSRLSQLCEIKRLFAT
jgi:hypothetical protein